MDLIGTLNCDGGLELEQPAMIIGIGIIGLIGLPLPVLNGTDDRRHRRHRGHRTGNDAKYHSFHPMPPMMPYGSRVEPADVIGHSERRL